MRRRIYCVNCTNPVSFRNGDVIVICPKCGWESYVGDWDKSSCALDSRDKSDAKRTCDLSYLLLIIPLCFIAFSWVTLPLIVSAKITEILLAGYIVITLLGTAVAAAAETQMARRLNSEIAGYVPVVWLTAFILFWPVMFPAYLYHRRKYLHKWRYCRICDTYVYGCFLYNERRYYLNSE
ncbi:MAG: hypothetical protein GY750_14935 [Lentisphaerae bacterium]|nr:hypothetical protein [Lentisphaerota bacterium]MCP4102696.1 hypothetical protein [Lentisphaerota bacterium]